MSRHSVLSFGLFDVTLDLSDINLSLDSSLNPEGSLLVEVLLHLAEPLP